MFTVALLIVTLVEEEPPAGAKEATFIKALLPDGDVLYEAVCAPDEAGYKSAVAHPVFLAVYPPF